MPVLDEATQKSICGGYDPNDCWWRCIAYIKSCGTSYSADDAMKLASAYYGSSFSDSSYAFSGNYQDCSNYISGYVTNVKDSYCQNTILVFNPNKISGWQGISGSSHAVIVQGYSGNYVNVFDPQTGREANINVHELNGSGSGFYVKVK